MNQRGLLFSVMMLFIVLAFISMNSALNESTIDVSLPDTVSFFGVLEKFQNVYYSAVSLYNGYTGTTLASAVPFDFEIKDTNFSFSQKIPLSSKKLGQLFDALNAMEVFYEDTQRSNAFDGLLVDLNVPKNSYWGGTETKIPLLLNPQCMEYTIESAQRFSLDKSASSKCTFAFNSSNFKKIEITITPDSLDDFNSFLCNSAACSNSAFDPLSLLPYYKVTINDSACTSCALSSKTASGHFDPSVQLNFSLGCVGACTSPPLTVTQKDLNFVFQHSGARSATIASNIVFSKKISDFFVPGVDLRVIFPHGNASKET